MTGFLSISRALVKGYVRDRQAVFFTIFFPLMFLVLFGSLLSGSPTSEVDAVAVGDVPLVDDLPADARAAFDDAFNLSHTDDRAAAVDEVRDGDAAVAIEQDGDRLVVHYSDADQVRSAVARGTLQSFVQSANLAAADAPATYTMQTERVEDESLSTIQFMTPGLVGWAIATSATFGAGMTLVSWRRTKLLRRLRLAPVSTRTLVGARVGVTLGVALTQLALFLGLGVALFGLSLTGWWWLSVPLVLCGTVSFMALGLLAGAVSQTVEGASALANIFVLPMAFLSGSFFPLDAAPQWIQAVSRLLPLRYLNDGMLDVLVRGQGPAAVVLPALVLLAFGGVVTLVASRFFRWEAS